MSSYDLLAVHVQYEYVINNPTLIISCSDIHHEPNTDISETCKSPNYFTLHKVKSFVRYGLIFVRLDVADIDNDVTIVVNCYEVVSLTPL